MTLILPPDIEAFLCDYLRAHITDVDGLQVGSKKPPDYQARIRSSPSGTMAATLTGSAISAEASA